MIHLPQSPEPQECKQEPAHSADSIYSLYSPKMFSSLSTPHTDLQGHPRLCSFHAASVERAREYGYAHKGIDI